VSRRHEPSVVAEWPGGRLLKQPCPADPVMVGRVIYRLTAAMDADRAAQATWTYRP